MSEIDMEVQSVLDEAFARYVKAERKYGTLDIEKDPRNFLREAEEELLDMINYGIFQVIRLRRLKAKLPAPAAPEDKTPPMMYPGVDGF